MTLLPVRELSRSAVLQTFAGRDLPATLGEALSETISDPLLRPTELLAEMDEEARLKGTARGPFEEFLVGGPVGVARRVAGLAEGEKARTDLVDPDDIAMDPSFDEARQLGVELDAPTPRPVVDLITKRKREEAIRNDVIARGPGGLAAGGLKLGAAFLGAAVDPLNIAAAFVPGLREGRIAGFLAANTRTIAARRAAQGAFEGFAGAIAVEPIVFASAGQLQLDYGMTDALLNVGIGSALGSGLHVVGGAVGDRLTRRRRRQLEAAMPKAVAEASPEIIDAAHRAAVSQHAQGRDVDVAALYEVDRHLRERGILSDEQLREVVRSGVPERIAPDDPEVEAVLDTFRSLRGVKVERPETLTQFIAARGGLEDFRGEIRSLIGEDNLRLSNVKGRPNLIREDGLTLDEAGEALWEEGFFQERPTPAEVLDALDEDINGGGFFRVGEEEALEGIRQIEEARADLDRLGIDLRMSEARVREIVARDIAEREVPHRAPVSVRDVREAIEIEQRGVEGLSELGETFDAARARADAEADIELAFDEYGLDEARTLDDLLAEDMEAMAEEGLFTLDEDEIAFLREADAVVKDAEDLAPVFDTAAHCLMRKS